MSREEEWDELVNNIKSSPCGQMFPGTKCVIGRGSLSPRVVFVGEAPGAEEDKQGLPFVGRSGKLLDEWVSWLGLSEDEVYILNVLKCRPPGNRDPSKEEVAVCEPYLQKQLDFLSPDVVVAVGRFAMKYFFPKMKAITRESGQLIDGKYFVTPHPSYFLRRGGSGWEEYLEELRLFLGGEVVVEKQKRLV